MTLPERVRRYLDKLPPAVAGAAGHAATFAAACRLVEFGLTFDQAAPIFATWNVTHCQRPWNEAELIHKLADAFKRTAPKPCFAPAAPPSAQRPFFRGSGHSGRQIKMRHIQS